MQSALLLYMECDWTVEPASKCLSMLGVRKRWRTLRPVVLQDMLERECLDEDEDFLMKALSAHEQRVDSAAVRAHIHIRCAVVRMVSINQLQAWRCILHGGYTQKVGSD